MLIVGRVERKKSFQYMRDFKIVLSTVKKHLLHPNVWFPKMQYKV